jgi:hypothetical protein
MMAALAELKIQTVIAASAAFGPSLETMLLIILKLSPTKATTTAENLLTQ